MRTRRHIGFSMLWLAIIHMSCGSNRQCADSALYTDWDKLYLHGPVREVLTIEKRNFEVAQNARYNPVTDVKIWKYVLFDSLGLFSRRIGVLDSISLSHFKAYPENGQELFLGPDFARLDTLINIGSIRLYDAADVKEKCRSCKVYDVPLRVYNPSLRQANYSQTESSKLHLKKDSISWEVLNVFAYEQDRSGRVIEATLSMDWDRFNDRKPPVLIERVEFIYDEKGRIDHQVYHFDEGRRTEYFDNYSHNLEFGLPILGPEFYTLDSVSVSYTYDSQDRIQSLVVRNDDDQALKHRYTYSDEGWLEQLELWVTPRYSLFSLMAYGEYCEYYFNKQGHPIRVISYNGDGSVHRERLYDYEYDHHGNWIRCLMWLEGVREGIPQKEVTRYFNYFEE